MSEEAKTRTTTILLIIAVVQGPIIYYLTFGFFKLFGAAFFGLIGLILTLFLLLDILRHRGTNTKYHIIGLISAFVIGLSTILGYPVEYLDWTLRRWERDKVVEEVKQGQLTNEKNSAACKLLGFYILPLSNEGNEIDVNKYGKFVHIEFYIDRGFLDHFSAFVYTNDPNEIQDYDNGIGPFGGGAVKKLDENWYRVSY